MSFFRNLVGGLARLAPFIPGAQALSPWLAGANFLMSPKKNPGDFLSLMASGSPLFKFQGGELAKWQAGLGTPEAKAAIAGMQAAEAAESVNARAAQMQKLLGKMISDSYGIFNTDLEAVDARTIAGYDEVYEREGDRALRDLNTSADNPFTYNLNNSVMRGAIHGDVASKKAGLRADLEQSRPFRRQRLLPNLGGVAGALAIQSQYDATNAAAQQGIYENAGRLNRLSQPTSSSLLYGLKPYNIEVQPPSYIGYTPRIRGY